MPCSLRALGLVVCLALTPTAATASPDQPSPPRHGGGIPAPAGTACDQRAERGRLTGSVSDPQGGRIAGAVVIASCGTTQIRTATNAEGRFDVAVPSGVYLIRVTHDGFEEAAVSTTVAATPGVPLDVTLAVAAVSDNVTVVGDSGSRGVSATKSDMPLARIPQSVTLVTGQEIRDRGAQSVQDALNYAAGVRSDAYGLDSRSDSVSVRGGYPTEYVDGLRQQLGGYYTSTTRTDPYQLERIEVLRGPASMLFGQGSTGGVVNEVTKQPQALVGREAAVQLGSFGRVQAQADMTGPMSDDGRWLYRLVVLGRHADTQVDDVPDHRMLIAPSISWRNDTTSLLIHFTGQRDRSGSTLQFEPWMGTVLPNPNGRIPTGRFLGKPGLDHYDSDRMTGGWLVEHRALGWTFRQNARISGNTVDYGAFYPDSYTNPEDPFVDDAQRMMNRYFYLENRRTTVVTLDQQAGRHVQTGGIDHDVLAGVEYVHARERSESAFDYAISLGGGVPDVDVYSPAQFDYVPPATTRSPTIAQYQTGVYGQDAMTIARRFTVLAGIRRDWTGSTSDESDKETDAATTGRVGVMYRFDAGMSPFVSYSQSFTPVTGSNLFGERFKPLRGEQVELGIKFEPATSKCSGSVAVYDLRERNRLVGDPTNPLNSVQVGETRTRGLELEGSAQLLAHLDLSAHYNFIDIDPQLEGLPSHQMGLWTTYRFAEARLSGAAAGIGIRAMSSFADGAAPVTPASTLVDGMVSYDRGAWRYALTAQNLTDRTYVSTCLARGDCFYGARRTVALTLTHRF